MEYFSPQRCLFEEYKELEKPLEIFTSKEGIIIYSIEIEIITVEVIARSRVNNIIIEAYYALNIETNLLSASTLLDKGYEISMKVYIGIKIRKNGVAINRQVTYKLDY